MSRTEKGPTAEETIERLFRAKGLGRVLSPIEPVSGGLMHRMFKVSAESGTYAVKQLNPEVMRRPDAPGNFQQAEKLERVLEDAGIPIVPALTIRESKMQSFEGRYYYVFPWINGQVTDPNGITLAQCRAVGNILGRIHALSPKEAVHAAPKKSCINWSAYAEQASRAGSGIALLIRQNERLLAHAQDALNRSRPLLPDTECITDGDMDPKNVMWCDGCPFVIDLECLTIGNPASDALQLALHWAGDDACRVDTEKLKAFFEGYLNAYDSGFKDYAGIFGVSYTWLEWLEYNVKRALGQYEDEAEKALGLSEAVHTVDAIWHIYDKEDEIKRTLNELFGRKEAQNV